MAAEAGAHGDLVVVGVGALGSHFSLLARGLGPSLRLVDFDRVEHKNTLAQLHTKLGLGKNKAVALQQLVSGLFGARATAVPHKLTADNARAVLAGASLVVDCTDNAAARAVIRAAVRETGTPCVHGALSADGAFARIVWDEHFVADHEPAEGAATCEDGARLPFFALAAAELALVAQRFYTSGARVSVQVTPGAIVRLA